MHITHENVYHVHNLEIHIIVQIFTSTGLLMIGTVYPHADIVNARPINSLKLCWTTFLLIINLFLYRYCYHRHSNRGGGGGGGGEGQVGWSPIVVF